MKRHCIKSLKMLLSCSIEDLHDDGFEDSMDDNHIFREVFFGHESGISSQRCFVTGAVNYENDEKMPKNVSLCSDSDNSVMTIQEDFPNIKEDSGQGSISEEFALFTRNGSDVEVKRRKVSPGEYSGSKYYLKKVVMSSIPSKEIENCLWQPAASSGQGDGFFPNDQKAYDVSKAIASPVSEESHADKLLFTRAEPVLCPKRRWKASSFIELDKDELSIPVKDSTMDPKPLLRYHTYCLLQAAGWVIGRRNRITHCKGRGEYVFKSPEGRPIREFHRAWNMCGKRLVEDAKYVVGYGNGIRWTDLTQFRSDLSDALAEVEELRNSEAVTALAHSWYLLDPFAKVVFIDKILPSLKEGKEVKAERGAVNTLYLNYNVFPSKKVVTAAKQNTERPGKKSSSMVPFSAPACRSDRAPCQTNNLYEVPTFSATAHTSTGWSKSIYPCQDGMELWSGCMESSVRCEKSNKHQKEKIRDCYLRDDDLLLSAILSNRSTTKCSGVKRNYCVPKVARKYKSQKGSCRLLPRSTSKGGQHHVQGKWSGLGVRTVLTWLIDLGVLRLNETIQYRNLEDDSVVKDGLVTRDGILCRCCKKVLSVSEFKNHAGFSMNRPCLNLFMESGKSYTLCQLEAWSTEYKVRKSAIRIVQVEEIDHSDDSCGLCGDGGELICCDNCPSTFHQTCLSSQDLPEGNWYCSMCCCWSCGNVVNDIEASVSKALKCLQCERKYHEECVKENGIERELVAPTWFCGETCEKIHSSLQSWIGCVNPISDGFSWTLLRCIHGDQKVHSAQTFVALKAECNLKLAVALTILEECFLPMVDTRTGIHMIPHVLYNWGSEFVRLNYEGFYTVVLEKDDILLSVASIRIHGATVAELPLIATCSRYRRQGMCRLLMNAIEEMLKSFKVEQLVVSAIPSLVETWTHGFGFSPLEADEKKRLDKTNLMVFPGTVWLKKPMYQGSIQSKHFLGAVTEAVTSDLNLEQATSMLDMVPVDCKMFLQEVGDQDDKLVEQVSKLLCEEPRPKMEGSSGESVCDVNSSIMYDTQLPLDEQFSPQETMA